MASYITNLILLQISIKNEEDESEDFFSIKLNIKNKHLEKLKSEQELSVAVTSDMQTEVNRLKMRVGNKIYQIASYIG